jgi:hypothetical protein
MIPADALAAARSTAQSSVERALHQTLCAAQIPTVKEPIPGGSVLFARSVPADWLDGLAIAHVVANAARGKVGDYVRSARGAGASWRELAAPLGVPTDDEDIDPGAAVFELIAGPPPQRFDRVTMYWRCTTCDKLVIDSGPYDGHPDDCETGHDADCARHRAEIRAHMQAMEADE